MKRDIAALRKAILAHPSYVSGDDSLRSAAGVVRTARMVLDRIKSDVPLPPLPPLTGVKA